MRTRHTASPTRPALPRHPRQQSKSNEPPTGLIGVDDIVTPYWAQVDERVATATTRRMLATIPRVLATTTRRAWQAAPVLTATTILLELLSGAVTAFGLLSTAQVFTTLLTTGPTPDRLVAALPALALVTASYAAAGLLDTATGLVQATLTPRVERDAQTDLYTALIGVDLVAHDDADFTELVQRAAGTGLSQLRSVTTTSADLLASLVSVAAAMTTAGLLHPALAPVVLFSVVPQGWASIRVAKIQYSSFLKMTSRVRRLGVTAGLITSRSDAAEVRAFTTQDVLLGEHRRITDQLTAEAITVQRRAAAVRLTGRSLAGFGTGGAYLVLGLLIYAGTLPLALAGAAALALRTATSAVSTSVYSANRLYESSFYLELFERCLLDATTRTRPADAALPAGAPRVIELRDVGFTYPDQPEPAIAGLTLTLRAGQTVALVGENGSGKSTLAKLITGLYLPDTGTIRWDGTDIAAVEARALHDRVAVVMQNPTEWPMTAADNIRIGNIHLDDPERRRLLDVAARSGADIVAEELPNGWDTMLSRHFQTGRDLSGGQWQRISVARGLYRNAPLVVADEPTAAMDARAEHRVFTQLHELANHDDGGEGTGERITVLITHRLANVRHADLIAVLHHGQLTESGTHDELLAAGGGYAEMFTLQAAAYHDPAPLA
ncbi:ABC transporter ATP-binding protein [Pseudonocardia sp. TRM90224]|uniref:ABC transporter ATP-binding protein n=1 Tax=Pseudonocardia sp. TRM90224 TaxID=2812678 RepID=UPI001E5D3E0A|nr:ABC transporter ATP-binding protein [Pseudonocardia sp. TRM90224]